MIGKSLGAVAGFAVLAACGGGGTSNGPAMNENITFNAAFETPDATGMFAGALVESTQRQYATSTGNGFAYEVGTSADGFVARAGLLPNIRVASAPTTTSVQMPSIIYAQSLSDGAVANGVVQGETLTSTSLISLTADFDSGTLTGSADLTGNPNAFVVNGRMTDSLLSGTVTYDGITGNLTGLVGADEAIGAFQGQSDGAVMAGGFIKFEPTP